MKKFKNVIVLSCFTFLIIAIILLFIVSPSMATTYCVANEADLIAALNDAKDNGEDDVIQIQQGTYSGNFVYASTESFDLNIEGGYRDALCSLRDVNPENTILDGENSGAVLVLSAPDAAVDFVVDGLTLQNGNTEFYGGGLFIKTSFGNVTVIYNKIINNSGGLFIEDANSLTLSNNIVMDNVGGFNKGSVHLSNCLSVLLDKNIISNNMKIGIYCRTDTITVSNNTISNNQGGAYIRGPINEANAISLVNNSFNYNTSEDVGGVLACAETILLENNFLSHNTARLGGGLGVGPPLGCTVSEVTLFNNIISHNSATEGGGVYIRGYFVPIVTLTNNTIWDNNSNSFGGGIWLSLNQNLAAAFLNNNIIMNNSATDDGDDLYLLNDHNNDHLPSVVNLLNNDFDQSEDGTYIQIPFPIDSSNLDNLDPQFVPAIDDYHLKEDSQLINAGNNLAPELPATDKDGNPRIVGSAVDIGAYEYQGFVNPVAAFVASPLVGVTPLSVNFSDESTGSIDSWYWDFGDGHDSTLQNPTNTYNVAGTYPVSLTVMGDSVSDTETKIDYIIVVSPDAPDLSCRAKEFHSYEFGQKIVVKLQVENSGNTKAEPFDVAFYLSDNGITQDELIELNTVNGGLNSQHTKVVSLRYESEISLSGKYIIAVIDPDGRVLELDETNNVFSIRIP